MPRAGSGNSVSEARLSIRWRNFKRYCEGASSLGSMGLRCLFATQKLMEADLCEQLGLDANKAQIVVGWCSCGVFSFI